jgi:glycine cleavage system H protein
MKAEELKYSKDHIWVAVDGNLARMGITEHAERELGEVVFLDLPAGGRSCAQGEVVGSIESVKATNDLFTPLSGEVRGGQLRRRDSRIW